MTMEQLRELGRSTVEHAPLAPSHVEELRARIEHKRRRHARGVAAVAVVALLACVVITFTVLDTSSHHRRVRVGTPTNPPSTSLPGRATAFPEPTPPREQVRAELDRTDAPLAVGTDAVWVGTSSGVTAFDRATLHELGHIPMALPVVELSVTPTSVWALTGSTAPATAPEGYPPYHLTRIDPVTRNVVFESDLPYLSSAPSNRHVRLAAEPDVAWISFGTEVLRIDTATNAMVTISLSGRYAAHIATDETGLWIATNGGDSAETAAPQVLRVDASTNAITTVPGVPNGFMWSIASTGDAAWFVEVYVDPGRDATSHLVRVDAATLALTAFQVPGIVVIGGDGQLWVRVVESDPASFDQDGIIGLVDPTNGSIVRTVDIAVGGPGTSDGYINPPFAVVDGQIWSAYRGLERTTP